MFEKFTKMLGNKEHSTSTSATHQPPTPTSAHPTTTNRPPSQLNLPTTKHTVKKLPGVQKKSGTQSSIKKKKVNKEMDLKNKVMEMQNKEMGDYMKTWLKTQKDKSEPTVATDENKGDGLSEEHVEGGHDVKEYWLAEILIWTWLSEYGCIAVIFELIICY